MSLRAECSFTVPNLLDGLTGSDNCSTFSFAQSPVAGTLVSSSPNQTHTVTITATDEAGNATQKPVTLTGKDEQKPSVITQNISVVLNVQGTATITPTQIDNGSLDNCTPAAGLVLALDKTSFDCSDVGTNTVMLTVTDASNNVSTAIATVTVDDKTVPVITTNGNQSVSNDAGACGAIVTVSASATDNCTVSTPTGVRSDGKPLTDEYPVGTTTITWNVTDANGNAASAVTQTVTVSNAATTLSAITGPIDPVQVNTAVNLSVNFTDNNMQSATWNWGNGATSAGTITGSTVQGTYTYTTAGVYSVMVTVTDKCGASVGQTYNYVVSYDPSAGFVTGGGWINSPAGAYAANPSLTGKASFGFVSKYQKGATIPTGNTDFQFNAGGLSFKSTVYEWLTVAGAKAQFKGSGKINGAGDYKFLLTAVDGQVNGGGGTDKFRIKISGPSGVVYDNKMGANETYDISGDASTVIGGVSIVIHTGGKNAREGYSAETTLMAVVLRCFPNPAEEMATIEFMLPKGGGYSLHILDMKGSLVRQLQTGKAEAGQTNQVTWEVGQTPSGLYITHLITEQGTKAIKLLVK